jgi:hypothetical protein
VTKLVANVIGASNDEDDVVQAIYKYTFTSTCRLVYHFYMAVRQSILSSDGSNGGLGGL